MDGLFGSQVGSQNIHDMYVSKKSIYSDPLHTIDRTNCLYPLLQISRSTSPYRGYSHSSLLLALPDLRARNSVRGEARVDVGGISRVSFRERPWNRHQWGWSSTATTSDRDLSAGDVELGDSPGPWVVDGQLLDAKEILSVRYACGDCDAIGQPEVPGRCAAAEGRADVLDLEPDVTGAVE